MKIENLHEGQVFKNYKELCAALGLEVVGGNQKKSQIKDIKRYCSFSRDGYKYIIDEIYDVPKPKEGGKESEYKEMKSLILRLLLLSRQESNRAIFSIPEMLQGIAAINCNYKDGRRHQKELGKYLDIKTEYINDFYNATHDSLTSAVETNLNQLMKRDNLILWGYTIKVCKNTPKIKLNELGEFQLDANGHITYEVQKDYRLATVDEKEFILKTEKQILKKMGYQNIGHIIGSGKADEFYDSVNEILKEKCNIDFYYKAYEIVFSREVIEKELEKATISYMDEKEMLNARVKDRIVFNAEKRKEDAMHKVSRDKIIQARRSEEYIENVHKILGVVIDLSADNIRNELTKSKK